MEKKFFKTKQGSQAVQEFTNQGNAAPRASDATDGAGFSSAHMDTAMSDGGASGSPKHGKSNLGKWSTAALSQAVRRRQKPATGGGL